jgi:hypothetical protein
VLQPGFGPLNWNSLAIDDFIASGNRAIKEFTDVVNQVCLGACWRTIICFLGLAAKSSAPIAATIFIVIRVSFNNRARF